ncbi:MAG: Flp family type IVb pilin [Candidatus Brocadiia bacterium]
MRNERRRMRGQALTEYAINVALISVLCIVYLMAMGQGLRLVFTAAAEALNSGDPRPHQTSYSSPSPGFEWQNGGN